MKILSMSCLPLDLELACFGTISKYAREKHDGHIVISKKEVDWSKKDSEYLRASCEDIGISEVHFLERFDYLAVTQGNVNALSSIVKSVGPSMVIMPSWKAFNRKRKILANSALIACRGIGSILMYELDNNKDFVPDTYVIISEEIARKKRSLKDDKSNRYNNLNRSYAKQVNLKSITPVEAFESHRILLVDDTTFS
jgi:LmbE family N-acetylglucosaminyl deacetylase